MRQPLRSPSSNNRFAELPVCGIGHHHTARRAALLRFFRHKLSKGLHGVVVAAISPVGVPLARSYSTRELLPASRVARASTEKLTSGPQVAASSSDVIPRIIALTRF